MPGLIARLPAKTVAGVRCRSSGKPVSSVWRAGMGSRLGTVAVRQSPSQHACWRFWLPTALTVHTPVRIHCSCGASCAAGYHARRPCRRSPEPLQPWRILLQLANVHTAHAHWTPGPLLSPCLLGSWLSCTLLMPTQRPFLNHEPCSGRKRHASAGKNAGRGGAGHRPGGPARLHRSIAQKNTSTRNTPTPLTFAGRKFSCTSSRVHSLCLIKHVCGCKHPALHPVTQAGCRQTRQALTAPRTGTWRVHRPPSAPDLRPGQPRGPARWAERPIKKE